MIFRRIGRAFRRVGRVFRRVGSFVGKVASFIQKPLSIVSKLTAPLQKLANKVLDKIPFGRFLKPFVQKFLSNPLAFVSLPGVGALGMLAQKAASLGKLGDLVKTIDGAVGGLRNMLSPQGLNNVAQVVAHAQAQEMLRRMGLGG